MTTPCYHKAVDAILDAIAEECAGTKLDAVAFSDTYLTVWHDEIADTDIPTSAKAHVARLRTRLRLISLAAELADPRR